MDFVDNTTWPCNREACTEAQEAQPQEAQPQPDEQAARRSSPRSLHASLRSSDARRRQRGLTLIEILVVVTILGLIAGVVGIAVVDSLQGAQRDTAAAQISQFGQALDLYKVKFGRYPTTAEGLQALAKPPGDKAPIMEKIPKDPWDADYIYVSPGQRNSSKYDLQSKGPDGNDGTDDDIKN